jgi:hypothetical protein
VHPSVSKRDIIRRHRPTGRPTAASPHTGWWYSVYYYVLRSGGHAQSSIHPCCYLFLSACCGNNNVSSSSSQHPCTLSATAVMSCDPRGLCVTLPRGFGSFGQNHCVDSQRATDHLHARLDPWPRSLRSAAESRAMLN